MICFLNLLISVSSSSSFVLTAPFFVAHFTATSSSFTERSTCADYTAAGRVLSLTGWLVCGSTSQPIRRQIRRLDTTVCKEWKQRRKKRKKRRRERFGYGYHFKSGTCYVCSLNSVTKRDRAGGQGSAIRAGKKKGIGWSKFASLGQEEYLKAEL